MSSTIATCVSPKESRPLPCLSSWDRVKYDMHKNKTSETISGVMSPYGFNTTSYDNQDRLTSWNRTDGALDQSWNLSKEGDWNSFTENTVTQARSHTGVHELTSIDTTPLTYDAKGNLTTNSNGQSYTWDFDNRMRSATVPVGATEGIEGTYSYTYDALGRRASKSVDDGVTVTPIVFVSAVQPLDASSLAGQILAEYASGSMAINAKRKNVYATYIDEPSLLIDGSGENETLYWYHCNSLYSVAALTDASTAVVERYGCDAYGVCRFLDANATIRQGSLVANSYVFTGRRLDPETSLYYFRARHFDSHLGRFTSRDPIGYEGSKWSLFEYGASRPLTSTDPSGKKFVGPICAECIGAFQKCEFGNGAGYAACVGGSFGGPIVTELGCHLLCKWLIGTGPGFAVCEGACLIGNMGLFICGVKVCNRFLQEGSMKCGNEYNRCSFKKCGPGFENWRPDDGGWQGEL